jgi:phosphoglycerol transferase MdoB-like AlkP superfamily enzyme
MLKKLRIPKTIQWVFNLFCIFLLIFTVFRVSTFYAFRPVDAALYQHFDAFCLGLRFDIRWICILIAPIILISFVPAFSPFYSLRNKKIWTTYLAIITLFVFIFFGADFGSFAYDSTRLNAIALNFVDDASITLSMIWQTYPVIWILVGVIVALWFFKWLFHKTHWRVETINSIEEISYQQRWYFTATVLLAIGIYGGIATSPLKRNDAFVYKDNFQSYLALNPLQNFFTTLRLRKPNMVNSASLYFAEMQGQLMLPANAKPYVRHIAPGSSGLESKPNVVLVLCESFSMYKSSMSGNVLNTTPYFNELCKEGVFFNRCFTPSFGTARGLFALITGIPDVQQAKFSTQNDIAYNQHTIINNFEGYQKMYFLGGSSEFNNFKGLLSNIKDLQFYEEDYFKLPKINVWGISDKNLFLEANKVFSTQKDPFFAIIQTADNHRPYTIPEDDSDFERVIYPADTLIKYGFESQDEMDAFRYQDYCFKTYIEAAKKQPYFNNTIFVFIGDHGVAGNASNIYPDIWTSQRLTAEHVPLLFYAPRLLLPSTKNEIVSQVDVLPTIASICNISYTNKTLGRNLFDKKKKTANAFIIHHDEGKIGLLQDDYFFIKNFMYNREVLLPSGQLFGYTGKQQDSIKKQASKLTTAIYETAKWMLIHNKRE